MNLDRTINDALRAYNDEIDWPAALRIWQEIGWADPGDTSHDEGLRRLLDKARVQTVALDGSVEAFAASGRGTLHYLDEALDLHAVQAVVVSRVARKQGLAARLTADAVAHAANEGALVSALGFFEQGFYDHLGFGSMPPCLRYQFDPARLAVTGRNRRPRRIGIEQVELLHEARRHRMKYHGAVNLADAIGAAYEYTYWKHSFCLGYFDAPGDGLSHYLCIANKGGEYGPYDVKWMVYQNTEQAIELLLLLKSLADQVRCVSLVEPPGLCIQDLLDRPIQALVQSEDAKMGTKMRALSFQALRINDLPACLDKTHLPGPGVAFNLELSDPVIRHLDSASAWRGIGGEYTVRLGPESSARPGRTDGLPTLCATVPGFSRLWLGAQRASSLAITGVVGGEAALLRQLDTALGLPLPHFDWEF